MTGSINPNIPAKGEALGASDAKVKSSLITLRDGLNAILGSGNRVETGGLEAAAKPVTWYTPKVIETEESRTNTAFGTLTTADEITGVVVPANGLVFISYEAVFKSSVGGAGAVGLFIGSNQIENAVEHVEADTEGTSFLRVSTYRTDIERVGSVTPATTGRVVGVLSVGELAAGTYAISARYKATSGSVTAKERLLRVEVHGF